MTPPHALIRDGRTRSWLRFGRPDELVVALRLEDVVPALRRVEAAARDGVHAAGFVSYEAAPAFDRAIAVRPSDGFPLVWFGLHRHAERVATVERPDAVRATSIDWTPDVDRATYRAAVDRITRHLADGDTYQVNYTFRLGAPVAPDAWSLFLRLLDAQDAPYSAWIDTGRFGIASASPELFFDRQDRRVTCRPMKGTTRRGRFTTEDRARAEALRQSAKNRAENVMIVDMVRNDLGRVADVGTVRVPDLFTVDRYPTLWQMTSTVTGETEAGLAGLFGALFPSASITGAPKVRTSQIIAEVETSPRGVYTGAIGVVAPDGWMQFNVAIRTAVVDRETGRAEYGVGSGVVWDSRADDEYDECLLKARVLEPALRPAGLVETMRWSRSEGFGRLDRHLARLQDSAAYFGIAIDDGVVRASLDAFVAARSDAGPAIVRLVAGDGNDVAVTTRPIIEGRPPVRLAIAAAPVSSADVRLFHKTTDREVYDGARAGRPDADDVLLWNERGEITETTIANVVVRIDGVWWTPPVTCGLLAGTYRAELLDAGRIRERAITLGDLRGAESVAVVSSVRGWREVEVGV